MDRRADCHPASISRRTARTCLLSYAEGLFHLDCCAHPRVNTALKEVFPFGKTNDLRRAALKDTGSCHSDVREAAGTFRNYVFPSVKPGDEATPEFRYFGEGVRLTALTHHAKSGSFGDTHCVRFEVPV